MLHDEFSPLDNKETKGVDFRYYGFVTRSCVTVSSQGNLKHRPIKLSRVCQASAPPLSNPAMPQALMLSRRLQRKLYI